MKCYYHDNKEVIAACTECGRFICEECKVNINGKAVCKTCIENGVFEANKGYQYKESKHNTEAQHGYNNYDVNKSTQKSW